MTPRRWWDEGRRAISWAWLAPPGWVAVALVALGQITAPPILRATLLDHALEIGLGLAGGFMIAPLLAREWEIGSLPLVAVRTPLWRILAPRLVLALLWLAVVAIFGSWYAVRWLAPGQDATFWLWTTVGIALAPAGALAALALWITQQTTSAWTGELAMLALWLGSLAVGLFAPAGDGVAWFWQVARGYGLFAATFTAPAPPLPLNRLAWLAVALALLAALWPALRRLGRLTKATGGRD